MSDYQKLDPSDIKMRLATKHFIKSVRVVEEAGSTNDDLAELARTGSCGPGILLAAEAQIAGKGRMGRKWNSVPHKSLTFSFLCPNYFPRQPGRMTIGAALATASAIEKESTISPLIKWPNDLYINNKKIGGILAQTVFSPKDSLMVVGIGLNINAVPEFDEENPEIFPISLKEATGVEFDRTLILASILNEINATLSLFESNKSDFIVHDLRKRSLLLGIKAVFEWKNKTYRGKVVNHLDDLSIQLETDEGMVVLPGETASLVSFQRV